MNPNLKYRCSGCGEVNPEWTEEYYGDFVHIYAFQVWRDSGEDDYDIDQECEICGVLQLDIAESLENLDKPKRVA